MDKVKQVHIGAEVEESLRDELKDIAKRNERSFSAEIRRALRLHVMASRATEEETV